MNKAFFLLASCALMASCAKSSQGEKQKKVDYEVAGIWHVHISERFAVFMGLPKTMGTSYCVDFQPDLRLATVQLYPSGKKYSIEVITIDKTHYKIRKDEREENVFINAEAGIIPGQVRTYWYFAQSLPSDPSKYDGGKERYSSLDECMSDLKETDKFADENQQNYKRFPPGEATEASPKSKK